MSKGSSRSLGPQCLGALPHTGLSALYWTLKLGKREGEEPTAVAFEPIRRRRRSQYVGVEFATLHCLPWGCSVECRIRTFLFTQMDQGLCAVCVDLSHVCVHCELPRARPRSSYSFH